MIETIRNAWKIPELRKKILFTVFALLIFRLVLTAVVLTAPVVWWFESHYNESAARLVGPVAFFIGAFGGGVSRQSRLTRSGRFPVICASNRMTMRSSSGRLNHSWFSASI